MVYKLLSSELVYCIRLPHVKNLWQDIKSRIIKLQGLQNARNLFILRDNCQLLWKLFACGNSSVACICMSMSIKFVHRDLEVRHPRCVGSITKNFVYYTYSRTQLYFT